MRLGHPPTIGGTRLLVRFPLIPDGKCRGDVQQRAIGGLTARTDRADMTLRCEDVMTGSSKLGGSHRGGTADSRRQGTGRAVAFLLIAAILNASCSGDETFLPGLLADPMASYVPAQSELVSSREQEAGELLGKPVYAKVIRSFRIEESQSMSILGATVADAASSGWDVAQSSTTETLYVGTKDLSGREGRIWIGLQTSDPDPDIRGPRNQIGITLEYVGGGG